LDATTGPLQPAPALAFHKIFGPSFGQVSARLVSVETPARLGPRNCGQSAAGAIQQKLKTARIRLSRIIIGRVNALSREEGRPAKHHGDAST